MKPGHVAWIVIVMLLCSLVAGPAQAGLDQGRPFIGVLLDTAPLPDLLVRHLQLSPGQGVRVQNVYRNSPADKAGLERDDIIIRFDGRNVTSLDQLVDLVQKAGVDTKVELEFNHLGQRKTVSFKVGVFGGQSDWKYPREPDVIQSWQPGRIFRFGPGQDNWVEVPLQNESLSPFDGFQGLFREVHIYRHSNGQDYTITIEGDPHDEDTRVIVQFGETEYKTTVAHLDELPKEYQASAKDALEKARANSKRRWGPDIKLPDIPDARAFRDYFENLNIPIPDRDLIEQYRPNVKGFEQKIEEQMRQLQKRIEELEKNNRDMLDRLLDRNKKDTPGSSRQTDLLSPEDINQRI